MNPFSELKNVAWKKIWSKRFSIRLGENWVFSVKQFRKRFGIDFPDQVILIENGLGTGYLNEKQLADCSKRVLEKLKNGLFPRFEKNAVPVFTRFRRFCKQLSKKDFSKFSNQQLTTVWKQFLEKEDEWMNYVWFVFLLDEMISGELELLLKKKWPDSHQPVSQLVLASSKPTAAVRFKTELIKAVASKKDLKSESKRLAKQFAFFPILNMDEAPLNENDVLRQLNEIRKTNSNPVKELQEIVSTQKNSEKKYRFFLNGVKELSLKRLLDAAHQVAFYREYRNDLRQESYWHAKKLFEEIARRFKLSIRELTYCTRSEISNFLSNGNPTISKKTISNRIRQSGLANIGQKSEYLFDSDRLNHIRLFLESSKNQTDAIRLFEKKGIIHGTPASPGKVWGTAKIILDVQTDASKLKTGDILVTSTTNLAFVPLMKRAGGVVVDGGGLLTHAAIVSRELKIPCISGTQIATRVLQDGDRIEIDGKKGMLRLINKNKVKT